MSSNEDAQNVEATIYCQAHLLTRQEFNSSQSSQLFINCCFALSLSAMFWALSEASKNQSLYLIWMPLTVYLIFTVWRQYSVYYIPLQYYRRKAESEFGELITLIITFMLAAFSLVCLYWPHWSLTCLFLILLFNLIKLRQMRVTLTKAPRQTEAEKAIEALKVFRNRLWFYLAILFILIILMLVFQADTKEWTFSLISAFLPLGAHLLARLLYSNFLELGKPRKPDITADEYIEYVASAWQG
jgi:hypothetical protein